MSPGPAILLGRSSVVSAASEHTADEPSSSPRRLYRSGFLLAATNPKPILFSRRCFPNSSKPLLPQFFVLSCIFMTLSFITLMSYALVTGRAKSLLVKPNFAKWVNRVVGTVFSKKNSEVVLRILAILEATNSTS